MSQTMLSILALLIVTMFAYQQQRNVALAELKIIRSETAVMSTGVAVDRLEEISAMAFDEQTFGNTLVASPANLTPGPPFMADAQGNDIDDFHLRADTVARMADTDTVYFVVQTSVSYANEIDVSQAVAGPTKVKKVTARVYPLGISVGDTITVSQSYACGSRCTW